MIKILRQIDAQLDRPLMTADIDELYRADKGLSNVPSKENSEALPRRALQLELNTLNGVQISGEGEILFTRTYGFLLFIR